MFSRPGGRLKTGLQVMSRGARMGALRLKNFPHAYSANTFG